MNEEKTRITARMATIAIEMLTRRVEVQLMHIKWDFEWKEEHKNILTDRENQVNQ